MKRIFSICISILLTLSMVGAALMVSASEVVQNMDDFVSYDALVIGNVEDNANATDNGFAISMDGVSLYPHFSKTHYETGELISIRFELHKSFEGISVRYECDGFSIVGEATSGWNADTESQYYDVMLSYDGISEYPYFSFNVLTNADVTVCAEVYGYLSDTGLFISDSSFDAAKDNSYYHLVETGVWTMEEYNAVLEWEYSQYGIETSIETAQLNTTAANVESTMSTSEETTISGNLGWVDDSGIWHPMQYAHKGTVLLC